MEIKASRHFDNNSEIFCSQAVDYSYTTILLTCQHL